MLLFLFSSSGSGIDGEVQILHSRVSGIKQHRFGLSRAVPFQNDVVRRQDLSRLAHGQARLVALEAPIDGKSPAASRRDFASDARRQLNIGHLNVVRHSFAAEADGVDGNPLALDFRDGIQIDSAGVVGAVA